MFPVLIKVGPVTLYTYGLMIALGILVSGWYFGRRAEIEGENRENALDLYFYLVLAALIGSRVLYVLVEYEYFVGNPIRIFKIWEGGLVFYGGFIGAALTGFWYTGKHRMNSWKMADIAAPALALAHSIGRMGCLFAGCCYGKPTDSWLGITFTNPLALAPKGIPLYPTQIFESLAELTIFFILVAFRERKTFNGQLFLIWMGLYASARFVIEFFRGDPRGSLFDGISTSQGIALGAVVFVIALAYLVRDKNRLKK